MTDSIENRGSKAILWAIGLSVGVHLLVLIHKITIEMPFSTSHSTEEVIELSEIPPHLLAPQVPVAKNSPTREKQVVETEDAGNRKIDPNAALLGEHNQISEQEARAKSVDDFRSKTGTGLKSKSQAQDFASAPTGDEGKSLVQEDKDGISINEAAPQKKAGVKKNWKSLSLTDLSVNGDGGAMAASDDYLPHVATGDRTILSTREFKFFSYYNRVKDLLRQHWKPSIEREVSKMWSKGRMQNEEELTTKVVVLLNKEGAVQKVSKVGTSGFEEIDEAAVQAFRKASPFPHPPPALIEEDGFVRISWDFILQTAAAPRIQFQGAGRY